jgi:hypothetical protein
VTGGATVDVVVVAAMELVVDVDDVVEDRAVAVGRSLVDGCEGLPPACVVRPASSGPLGRTMATTAKTERPAMISATRVRAGIVRAYDGRIGCVPQPPAKLRAPD